MEELFLINNEFRNEDLELIRKFLEFRKISSNIKSYDEIKDENIGKSKIITNKLFEEKIGGREKLIKFGRNIGCSKILILESNSDKYSIQSHLGESVLNISFKKINDFILELLINIISQQKFSFADPRTLSLI